jgi:hypothetical protein
MTPNSILEMLTSVTRSTPKPVYTNQSPTTKIKRRKKFKLLSLSLFQWGTLILSAVTLIFLIKYTNYARRQWKEAKRTADQSVISATAAKSAAETAEATLQDSQKSFVLQNRPYVTIEVARLVYKPEGGKRLEATCIARNSGRTPAIGMTPDISIEGRTSPLPTTVTRLGSKSIMDIGSDQRIVIPVPGFGPIRPDSAARIDSGDLTVYVYGFLDYADVFGCKYTTEFCGYYDPRVDSENPLTLRGCHGHNRRIEYKCEPK